MPLHHMTIGRALGALAVIAWALPAAAQCGDVYAGSWRNPPFGFDIYKDAAAFSFTSGVFDAPDQTPIAVDDAENVYHAQTIDSAGTVRVYRNNVAVHTFGARGGPSWVYSGLGLAVEPGGSWYAAFYTAANTVTVYKDGNAEVISFSAHAYQGSPVGLAYDGMTSTLYISVRTAAGTVTIYNGTGAALATFDAVGVPVATKRGNWWAAVPRGASIDLYRNGLAKQTITGAFNAGPRISLAVGGSEDPWVLVGVAGGFGLISRPGIPLYTIPNTAAGGGTGLAIYAPLIVCDGCIPDITTGAIPTQPGYLVPNGIVNNDDFFAFLIEFTGGNLAVCDVTTTAIPGTPGYGVPNGIINNDDFFYYLAAFSQGC